jgi:hypothetical protein
MTLPVPNLDDRTFTDLVDEALDRAGRTYPEWTDRSVHDPGVALVEVFAHLTEVMLYRLNRLPEKAYVEFLNLLGVQRHPPAAAWVSLTFTPNPAGTDARPFVVPAGTQVAAARGANTQPVVFTVTETAALAPGATELTVPAYHCEIVEAELLGIGTGLPGQVLRVARAPIVTTTEPLDVLLGVETAPGTVPQGVAAREYAGKTFEIWHPVTSFAGAGPLSKVYILNRSSGVVAFAPALDLGSADGLPVTLAALPPANSEIRIWYRTGGGPLGNVAAGSLTGLRTPIPGVSVTNAAPARGGRAMEAIELAVARGPYEIFSLHRAVTARDFELLATSGSAAVARAKAFTRASMWSFAHPGEVETVLVPHVGDEARPDWRLPVDTIVAHQGDEALTRTQEDLDARRALGTSVITTWAHYKTVSVRGRLVVRAEDDPDAIRRRIHDRLHQTISPLPTPANPGGWGFGEPLRASNVYRWLELAEPGVRYVDEVRFVLQEAPDQRTRTLAAAAYQQDTWYAGCEELLFRSTNGARGWEPVGRFPGEVVRRVVASPAAVRPGIVARPGAVAAVTRNTDGSASCVYVSTDLGQRWVKVVEMEPAIFDTAWIDRDGVAALLLATEAGLYEVPATAGGVPLQIRVDDADPDRGFYAVCSFVSERGVIGVAAAAQAQFGVYMSLTGGRPGTFTKVGLSGVDTRTLAVQLDGPATVLWAGAAESDPGKPGKGCFRARLFEADVKWQALSSGWTGGTCWGLAFQRHTALAASQSGGVLRLDLDAVTPQWTPADVNGGLPLRDRTRFEPVEAVACGADGQTLASGPRGVYRCADAKQWTAAANRTTSDVVTVPDTWLLCSGDHDIEVVRDDATTGH